MQLPIRIIVLGLTLMISLCPAYVAQTNAQIPRRFATETLPEPRFADPERVQKLAAAFPEIEKMFRERVERQHMPGAVLGIIIDGQLVWVKSAGVSDLKSRTPVNADTVFRIASMTKSFTAMAILKLRLRHRPGADQAWRRP